MVSTYTSVFVVREIQNILMDQKIIPACCEGYALYDCDVKEKMGILSAGKYLYLYLCLLYKALVNILQR